MKKISDDKYLDKFVEIVACVSISLSLTLIYFVTNISTSLLSDFVTTMLAFSLFIIADDTPARNDKISKAIRKFAKPYIRPVRIIVNATLILIKTTFIILIGIVLYMFLVAFVA